LIETPERDRSIKREGMRQIASAFLGYIVPKSRGREENLNDIRRQSSDEKRWAQRMERIGLEPPGLEKGLSASFEEAKQAAKTTLMKLIAIDVGLPLSQRPSCELACKAIGPNGACCDRLYGCSPTGSAARSM
jgi:hypothetical protein